MFTPAYCVLQVRLAHFHVLDVSKQCRYFDSYYTKLLLLNILADALQDL